ncbi:MAG: hypothetical protein ACRDOS_08030 [Gaiellaceae bacterium]
MFYLRYMAAELRRRCGRTILTSLELAVGVGMVATVVALSNGSTTPSRRCSSRSPGSAPTCR